MDANNLEQRFLFFLSRLTENGRVPSPDQAGDWFSQEWNILNSIAASLEISTASQKTNLVSSIPNMWAQPLLMEMALHQEGHPLQQEMLAQWEAMLAAIALKEVRGFPLKAQLIDLSSANNEQNEFAGCLRKHKPATTNSLYRLVDEDEENPWTKVYVFLWNGKPVGMTSPSTLVCPAKAGLWTDLPWFLEGRLRSPLDVKKNKLILQEREQLWQWLDYLKKSLDQLGEAKESSQAINTITRCLTNFQERLLNKQNPRPTITFELSKKEGTPFGERIKLGKLEALNQTIQLIQQISCVRLCSTLGQGSAPQLLIIPNSPELLKTRDDKTIQQQWEVKEQNIRINENIHLGNFNREDLRQYAQDWQMELIKSPSVSSESIGSVGSESTGSVGSESKNKIIEAKDLFLDNFCFIAQENALCGGFLPKLPDALTDEKGQKITPLLPIHPLLLDYLSPEELKERIELESVENNQVRVKLKLPLSGFNDDNLPLDYEIHKDYAIKAENAIAQVPMLEIWPDFQAQGWQEYYVFYSDLKQGNQTFKIDFSSALKAQNQEELFADTQFSDEQSPPVSYRITHLPQFPSFISCQNQRGQIRGLILLKSPPKIPPIPLESWVVGFDFGTSFTNVYIYRKRKQAMGINEKLKLQPPLHRSITTIGSGDRVGNLREYFIPSSIDLPLNSILTFQGGDRLIDQRSRTILDGRVYLPPLDFPITKAGYTASLKWTPDKPILTTLFLKNLALIISAYAAKDKIKEIEWAISYPSAFSEIETENYRENWEKITQELKKTTGINHIFDEKQAVNYLTESLANAYYFDSVKEANLNNAVCIDIGGGTSDISLWEDSKLKYQGSVKLAGNNLLTHFLSQSQDALDLIFSQDTQDTQNTQNTIERLGLRDVQTGDLPMEMVETKFNILLRYEGEKALKKLSTIKTKTASDEKSKTLRKSFQLTELGLAGLYYYIGILLKWCRGNNFNQQGLPNIYIGGNGARLLHWTSNTGKFRSNYPTDKLLRQMLIKGLSFGSEEQANSNNIPMQVGGKTIISPPESLKNEVAYGLVLANQKKFLTSDVIERKYPYILGESLTIKDGDNYETYDTEINPNIIKKNTRCEVNDVPRLSDFLYNFTLAYTEFEEDDELLIFQDYNPTKEITQNLLLWTDVKGRINQKLGRLIRDEKFEPPFILGLKALLDILSEEQEP
jgi:hypothetical protein